MSEPATALDDLEGETIRVPRNVMGLLRQSYDSREKMLDWLLAIFVAGALVIMFRDQIMSCIFPTDPSQNAGRRDQYVPSMNVEEALPPDDLPNAEVYTYNMPPSRALKYNVGPSNTRPPLNPSNPATYSLENEDNS